MEDSIVTVEMVRKAAQSFGDGGQEITHAQIADALGLTCEKEKARMRSRMSSMVEHGELRRVRDEVFVYDFARRPREAKTLTSVWRFVRKAKSGWALGECALMTRVSYTQTLRYVGWLESAGYVEKCGKDEKKAVLYRATGKAAASPETPYPPQKETDPFQRERVAAATITRLMLCADPYAPKTGRAIVDACRTLLARFDKGGAAPVTINENENKSEEETAC